VEEKLGLGGGRGRGGGGVANATTGLGPGGKGKAGKGAALPTPQPGEKGKGKGKGGRGDGAEVLKPAEAAASGEKGAKGGKTGPPGKGQKGPPGKGEKGPPGKGGKGPPGKGKGGKGTMAKLGPSIYKEMQMESLDDEAAANTVFAQPHDLDEGLLSSLMSGAQDMFKKKTPRTRDPNTPRAPKKEEKFRFFSVDRQRGFEIKVKKYKKHSFEEVKQMLIGMHFTSVEALILRNLEILKYFNL